MKKILSLVLALILVFSLLPMAAFADEEAASATDLAKVKIYYGSKKSFTLTLNATSGPAYVVANEDGTYGKWTEAEAPADKFMKLEYVAGTPSVVKATMQNFVVDGSDAGASAYTAHTITFLGSAVYNVELEVIGENAMTQTKSSSLKFDNEGTITIFGTGTLSLTQTAAAYSSIRGTYGDLTIKDITLNMTTEPGESNNSAHHCIFMAKGSVTLENVKGTSYSRGGDMIRLGLTDKEAGGDGKGRSSITTDETRTITIKNCELKHTSRTGGMCVAASAAKISGSTLTLTKNSSSGRQIFVPAPVFEGDFSAIAGLAKNADKLDKLKVYNENKLGSYTYIYAVPGIVELLPTEPEVTVPDVTDPDPIVPDATTPDATEPDATEPTPAPTTPAPTTPAESNPATSAPDATQSAGDSADKTDDANEATNTDNKDGNKNNGLVTVVIIIVVLIVLAGGAVVTLLILKKKGIIK